MTPAQTAKVAEARPRRPLLPAAALRRVGQAAVVALYEELALDPKPGLVSFVDSGSHSDMDARTYMRSLFALRHYFPRSAMLGAEGADFDALQREGIDAERRMALATAGVNTHRGAIFTLGLLCASAGALLAAGEPLQASRLRSVLITRWGAALRRKSLRSGPSRGAQVALALGLSGAAMQGAQGFPVLFETTLPALRAGLQAGATPRIAQVDALFQTIAVLADTNLACRGSLAGLQFAQRAAFDFLQTGGARRPGGLEAARQLHTTFVAHRLSPGGAADMLAAACWLHSVCR